MATVSGILAVVIALQSPIDYWSVHYLWVHMLQHEILTMVAAPLLVLGAPWLVWWRVIPLRARRFTTRQVRTTTWLRRPLGVAAHWLTRPTTAWVLFVGDFALWHLPRLYDLTLQNEQVHYLEHLLFLATAVLFWVQVFPAAPLHTHLSRVDRAAFVGLALLLGTIADEIFIAAPAPVYAYYATLPRSAGAISAMTDQSMAGGIMDAVNGLVVLIALIAWWRWPETTPSHSAEMVEPGSRQPRTGERESPPR
jgi:cytochrome c oxidase assembly factor CtaG